MIISKIRVVQTLKNSASMDYCDILITIACRLEKETWNLQIR